MKQIHFGWNIPLPNPIPRPELLKGSSFLEKIHQGINLITGHFESVWCCDHLQCRDAAILEGWTALTYLAANHPQMFFGMSVFNQSLRNPALLAKMTATFQYLSEGRLICGIGAGWYEKEYRAYGYPFPLASIRVTELEEKLQIIKELWTNERSTVNGKYSKILDAYCKPKPEPIPPIMIGGEKPRILDVIAKYADWWNVDRTPLGRYKDLVIQCESACSMANRDPASLRRVWFGSCLCASTESDLAALRKLSIIQNYNLIGTSSQILEQLQAFIDLGIDYFILEIGEFPNFTTLEVLINEVLPKLNS